MGRTARQRALEERAERVARRRRARVLRRLQETERALDLAYRDLARRLRERLGIEMSERDLAALLEEEFALTEADVVPLIEQAILNSSSEGRETAVRVLRIVTEVQEGAAADVAAFAPELAIGDAEAFALGQVRVRGGMSVDGLSLSARFHRNHLQTASRLQDQLTASIRAGETIERTAERLLDEGDFITRIPQHVEDMQQAARRAALTGSAEDRALFEASVRRWERRVRRLGQAADAEGATHGAHTMRSATEQLVTELRGARAEQIDAIVDRWALDRARYQARMIARTETLEAHRASYQRSLEDVDGVVALRWTLSGRHPKPDVCDLFANQDLHGLGAGGYPADDYPDTPHPHCLCMPVAVIDRHARRRELAELRGDPEPPREWESGTRETGAEWLARQPERARLDVLGPTRARIFREPGGPARVLTAQGAPIPVHVVLGQPPAPRALGRRVRMLPIVEADRASMAIPFPAAPRLASGTR